MNFNELLKIISLMTSLHIDTEAKLHVSFHSKSRLNSTGPSEQSEFGSLKADIGRINSRMEALNERMDNMMSNMEPVMAYLKQHVLSHKVSK